MKNSTVVASTRYLRSKVLFFDMESGVENVQIPIRYDLDVNNIVNYPADTLLSSTEDTILNVTTSTKVWRTSIFSCATVSNNFTLETSSNCSIEVEPSNKHAFCNCFNKVNVIMV